VSSGRILAQSSREDYRATISSGSSIAIVLNHCDSIQRVRWEVSDYIEDEILEVLCIVVVVVVVVVVVAWYWRKFAFSSRFLSS
jgi:hypothetical protein